MFRGDLSEEADLPDMGAGEFDDLGGDGAEREVHFGGEGDGREETDGHIGRCCGGDLDEFKADSGEG